MIYSSKEIALAAAVPDNLQFMQDIRRHNMPIHAKKFNGANRYDLTSFAVAMIVGELREYGISLASCGRLLSRIDLDDLSHRTEHLHQNIASEPCFLTPFAKIYWHSSGGLRHRQIASMPLAQPAPPILAKNVQPLPRLSVLGNVL